MCCARSPIAITAKEAGPAEEGAEACHRRGRHGAPRAAWIDVTKLSGRARSATSAPSRSSSPISTATLGMSATCRHRRRRPARHRLLSDRRVALHLRRRAKRVPPSIAIPSSGPTARPAALPISARGAILSFSISTQAAPFQRVADRRHQGPHRGRDHVQRAARPSQPLYCAGHGDERRRMGRTAGVRQVPAAGRGLRRVMRGSGTGSGFADAIQGRSSSTPSSTPRRPANGRSPSAEMRPAPALAHS